MIGPTLTSTLRENRLRFYGYIGYGVLVMREFLIFFFISFYYMKVTSGTISEFIVASIYLIKENFTKKKN